MNEAAYAADDCVQPTSVDTATEHPDQEEVLNENDFTNSPSSTNEEGESDGSEIDCADTTNGSQTPITEDTPDYDAIMREDLAVLKSSFPELSGIRDVSELSNALRYATLRDLGLSAQEAYMAASAPRSRRDNRSHLSSAARRTAAIPASTMSHEELSVARELFSDMSDAQIQSLYKRVTG